MNFCFQVLLIWTLWRILYRGKRWREWSTISVKRHVSYSRYTDNFALWSNIDRLRFSTQILIYTMLLSKRVHAALRLPPTQSLIPIGYSTNLIGVALDLCVSIFSEKAPLHKLDVNEASNSKLHLHLVQWCRFLRKYCNFAMKSTIYMCIF